MICEGIDAYDAVRACWSIFSRWSSWKRRPIGYSLYTWPIVRHDLSNPTGYFSRAACDLVFEIASGAHFEARPRTNLW